MFRKNILFLMMTLVLTQACTGENKIKSFFTPAKVKKAPDVKIPIDLEKIKEKHSPPETVVNVKKIKKNPKLSSGSCHAAIVCSAIVFVNLYKNLFPERSLDVTIHEYGKLTYHGKFSATKEFIYAETFRNNKKQTYVKFDLEKLGKKIVFLLAESELHDGDDAIYFGITKQVDLISLYEKKIEKTKNEKDRGELYQEALSWLNVESKPLIFKGLKSKTESQKTKRMIVQTLCNSQQSIPFDWLNALDLQNNGLANTEALICLLENKQPQEYWLKFVKPAVQHMCKNEIDQESHLGGLLVMRNTALGGIYTLDELTKWSQKLNSIELTHEIQSALKTCQQTPVTTLARYAFELAVSKDDFETVLLGQLKISEKALELLKNLHEENATPNTFTREVVFQALKKTNNKPVNKRDNLLTKKLKEISNQIRRPWLTANELEILAQSYIKFPKYTVWENQQNVLEIFKLHQNNSQSQKATQFLEKSYLSASPQSREAIALALLMLGKDEWLAKAFSGTVDSKLQKNVKLYRIGSSPRKSAEFIRFSLKKLGCNTNNIQEIVDIVLKTKQEKSLLENKIFHDLECYQKIK